MKALYIAFYIHISHSVYHSITHSFLYRNQLVELPSAKRLSITPELSRLSVNRNLILGIGSFSLEGYDNLTVLHLSGNHIRDIEVSAFFWTPHLRELDLSENKIEALAFTLFNYLLELEKLDLRHNSIAVLLSGEFEV